MNGENGETEAGKPIILGQTLKEETYAAIHDGARSVIRAQNSLWLVKAQATVAKQITV